MCGIAGAIGFIDPVVADAVRSMSRRMVHRGPNGEGYWTSKPSEYSGQEYTGVILAHRRLAIIDLSSGGDQPMIDPDTGNAIAFNGEIYNYRELRSELQALGKVFRTQSDTEVLLVAYRQWGEDFVRRLRGIFAFVLWNPSAGCALMVRDHLGIKPLYWTAIRRNTRLTLLFASEVRALLESGLATRELDPNGLASYLWNGFVAGPGTIIRGINNFAPGCLASVCPESPDVTTKTYWRIPVPARTKRDIEPVQHALREAVEMQLVSDVPLGIFLSGGIDSSAVAALAVRSAGAAPIRTFTVAFDEARYDESGHASAVAAALGTEHRVIRLSQDIFRSNLSSALGSIDQPTFDAINTYFVSRAVREAGMTVALAGTGGDELFGGYASFRDIPKASRWARALAACPESALRGLAAIVTRLMTGPRGPVPPQTRWGKLGDVLATRGNLLQLYQLSYALFTPDFQRRLISVPLPSESTCGMQIDRYAELTKMLQGVPPLHAISMLELTFFIGERLLRDTDTASMAVALEARVPLLDHIVVERVSELSPEIRFEPLGAKALLRSLALDGLDPRLFDRPKSGFELPLDRWCRAGLRTEMASAFNDRALCSAVGLDGEAVQALWHSFQDRSAGMYWSRVWAIFVLLWWCRQYDVKLA